MSWVDELARPDILRLTPYEHALWDPHLQRLHANEVPWRVMTDESAAGLNRYPEPQPAALIARLAGLYRVAPESILVGRGSDEAIDLLVRAFCRAGHDSILICPPTFGMYGVCARIQGAGVVEVPLAGSQFGLDAQAVLECCTPAVKLVFLCSPNNPTGNLLDVRAVLELAERLTGRALLVVDEAYVEFSGTPGLAEHMQHLPQLALLRTLSKAYALAGARCGALIAAPEVIRLLRKLIPPYAITQPTLELVLRSLDASQLAVTRAHLDMLRGERQRLQAQLALLPWVTRVWPSDANFILVQASEPQRQLERAQAAGFLLRDVRRYRGLGHCVRITVGNPEQNARLLGALQ